ncbi:hypothetical protein K438DRAFT_1784811 [Mycena galopus ATCC 62051]|nr:hypothetical protein K438DRAFT_1784811 [Mycena galopus ATCC 62051]
MFEQAVDLGREIQCWILEKQAWHRMVKAWLDYKTPNHDLLAVQILPTKEEYLGVWTHGIPETDLNARGPGQVNNGGLHAGNLHHAPEYDRVMLRLNGGLHTLHDTSLPLPGVAFRAPTERLLSGSTNQWGPLPAARSSCSESPGGLSIPESDKDEEMLNEGGATVVTGSDRSTAPQSMILGTEVTIPMIEEVAQVEWCPRVHYYVKFNPTDMALRVQELVDTRYGTVQLVEFTKNAEFNDLRKISTTRKPVLPSTTTDARKKFHETCGFDVQKLLLALSVTLQLQVFSVAIASTTRTDSVSLTHSPAPRTEIFALAVSQERKTEKLLTSDLETGSRSGGKQEQSSSSLPSRFQGAHSRATVRMPSPAHMDVEPPMAGPSLLARLDLDEKIAVPAGEKDEEGPALFGRMGLSLEERMGDVEGAPKAHRKHGRPTKAVCERQDAERRKPGGSVKGRYIILIHYSRFPLSTMHLARRWCAMSSPPPWLSIDLTALRPRVTRVQSKGYMKSGREATTLANGAELDFELRTSARGATP